jgi:hypothetical protein
MYCLPSTEKLIGYDREHLHAHVERVRTGAAVAIERAVLGDLFSTVLETQNKNNSGDPE